MMVCAMCYLRKSQRGGKQDRIKKYKQNNRQDKQRKKHKNKKVWILLKKTKSKGIAGGGGNLVRM